MQNSEAMWAICVGEGKQAPLEWTQVQRPVPGPEEVLVQIHATALNRADLLQRRGLYPPPAGASEVLGLEIAGTIVALGSKVEGWELGQRVCALLEGGGYAEYARVHHGMLLPIPEHLSYLQAAAIPEVLYTAYLNLVVEGAMQPGESVLVHAGASGVGSMAIQLCNALGNPVYTTTSTSKLEYVRSLGVAGAWDRLSEHFLEELEASLSGVDLILDAVGGAYLESNVRLLGSRGRLILIGLLGGRKGPLDLGQVLLKRLRLIGSTLRNRSRREKLQLTEQLLKDIWPLFSLGSLQPVLHAVFPIREAEKAHKLLESNTTIGKIVLEVTPEFELAEDTIETTTFQG